jgi:hypothetical protein
LSYVRHRIFLLSSSAAPGRIISRFRFTTPFLTGARRSRQRHIPDRHEATIPGRIIFVRNFMEFDFKLKFYPLKRSSLKSFFPTRTCA